MIIIVISISTMAWHVVISTRNGDSSQTPATDTSTKTWRANGSSWGFPRNITSWKFSDTLTLSFTSNVFSSWGDSCCDLDNKAHNSSFQPLVVTLPGPSLNLCQLSQMFFSHIIQCSKMRNCRFSWLWNAGRKVQKLFSKENFLINCENQWKVIQYYNWKYLLYTKLSFMK